MNAHLCNCFIYSSSYLTGYGFLYKETGRNTIICCFCLALTLHYLFFLKVHLGHFIFWEEVQTWKVVWLGQD